MAVLPVYIRKVEKPFITLKEVLEIMDTGRKFKGLAFITCDLKKDTGGELVEVKEAHKHNWISPEDHKKQQALQPASNVIKKDPRHYENSTRNIVFPGGEIRKVHIRLIRKFEGKTVL